MLELKIAVVIVSYKSAGLTIDSLASIESERSIPGCVVRVFVVDNASVTSRKSTWRFGNVAGRPG